MSAVSKRLSLSSLICLREITPDRLSPLWFLLVMLCCLLSLACHLPSTLSTLDCVAPIRALKFNHLA
jgi:hypothetical protein